MRAPIRVASNIWHMNEIHMMKQCRINLLLMGLFATVLGLSMTSEAAPNSAKRPNVIVLFADDLGLSLIHI